MKQALDWPHVPVHGITYRGSGELCSPQQTLYIHVISQLVVSILLQWGAESCTWEVFLTASLWCDICHLATFPQTHYCSSSPLCLFPESICHISGVDRPSDEQKQGRREGKGRKNNRRGEMGKKGQEKAELPYTHKLSRRIRALEKKMKRWQILWRENWKKRINYKKKKTNTAGWGFFYSLMPKMCKQSNEKAAVLFEYIMEAAVGRSQVLTCSDGTALSWRYSPQPPRNEFCYKNGTWHIKA